MNLPAIEIQPTSRIDLKPLKIRYGPDDDDPDGPASDTGVCCGDAAERAACCAA